MSLLRRGIGETARASGVALLLPAGVTVGLLVAAGLGGGVGGGGLGALAQLVAGPASPGGVDERPLSSHRGPEIPAVPTTATAPAHARRVAAAPRPRRAPVIHPDTGRRQPSARRPAAPGPAGPGGGSAPAPPPSPSPPTRPAPSSPVRELVDRLDPTLRQVPVAGEPAADAVQTAIDLVAPPPAGARVGTAPVLRRELAGPAG